MKELEKYTSDDNSKKQHRQRVRSVHHDVEFENSYSSDNEGFEKSKEDIPDIDLDQIAQDEDLEVVWTTSGRNGYPENTHEALIGFDDFGQAERVAKRYGMEIMIFEQRDGWNLYYRTGRTAYGPIEVTSEDYGPDYQSFGPGVQQYYEDQVKPALSDCETFDELCELVEQQKKTCDAIKDLGENEMVLTYCGDYYDTVDRYAMSVHIDSKTTVIGVIRY